MKLTTTLTAAALAFAASFTAGAIPALAETIAAAPVIVSPEDAKWVPMIPEMGDAGPAMAVVFGEPGVVGKPFAAVFRVMPGGLSPMHIHSSDYWGVMLGGTESARETKAGKASPIVPGSYWFQPGNAGHINQCLSDEPCLFYVYFPAGMDYIPIEH